MSIKLITPPTCYPIDLADAKLHMRITFTDDDLLVKQLIGSAKNYAENFTHKQLVAARCVQTMDMFPTSPLTMFNSIAPSQMITLERGPVNQVVAVNYTDMGGVAQVMPASQYAVDYTTDPVRITPVFGAVWPIALPQIGAVNVVFDAGYAMPVKFTVAGNNAITISKNWAAYNVGDTIRFSNSGGNLPASIAPQTDYYILSVISPGVYTISATAGGSVITFTDNGVGLNFIGEVPDGLLGWLRLRMASFYENREELSAAGTLMALPYADRLLDYYKTWEF